MNQSKARSVRTCLAAVLFFFAFGNAAFAKNPFSSYFSRFLDESRAEIEIGKFLFDVIVSQTGSGAPTLESPDLTPVATRLASASVRPALPYKVYVLESKIPWEIPLPGGILVLTSGMVSLAETPDERFFLLARNIAAIALRQPMVVLKKEGLYSRILKVLKQPPQKRDPKVIRTILRDYIKAAGSIDQTRIDREGILLSTQPGKVREAGIGFLKKLGEVVWPFLPWDQFDLPGRIEALEGLKL